MTEFEIKEALYVYTQDAVGRKNVLKENIMELLPEKAKNRKEMKIQRRLVVATSLVLAILLFTATPMGESMAAAIKENIVILIEKIFQPKDIVIEIEGMEESLVYTPYVEEPVIENQEAPSFAIYVDETRYMRYEEDGDFIIRPIPIENSESEFYKSLPICEIRITQKKEISIEMVTEESIELLRSEYQNVSEVIDSPIVDGKYIHANNGTEWNAEVIDVYLIDNHSGGVYKITAKYFMEATEGHGMRFASMISTFEVALGKP